jgi:hypothetical protein
MLALGIFHVQLRPPFWSAQYLYGRWTGAGGSFGFFSPNVPREVDVDFLVEDASGVQTVRLQDIVAPEVGTRICNMLHLLPNHLVNEKILRSVAASLTASVFREFKTANKITLKASLYNFPSLDNYHKGMRAKSFEIYSATFERPMPLAVMK